MNYRKAILDDGCNPELVAGARFDGILEVPVIEKPSKLIVPSMIVPFTERNRVNDGKAMIGFNEMDVKFSQVLAAPETFIDDFRRFSGIISPDCSLYRDAPLSVQITNVYRNRAIGSYYQRKGIYVVPQIRWGSEATYTTDVLPEKVAFLGVMPHSIVAIGTYGCIQSKEDKYFFHAGLDAMMQALDPTIVLVYGPMPRSIFGEYLKAAQFVQFADWTKYKHGGEY